MLFSSVVLAIASVIGAAPSGDVMKLSASMPTGELAVGQEYEVQISLELADGWSIGAGVPKPILQVEAPASVHLSGRYLTEYKELARNEFLQEPYERVIDPGNNSVRFTLESAPTAGETISLNVVAYVSETDEEDAFFLRRRVELPVRAGVSSSSTEQANVSDWGIDNTLNIGDRAEGIVLPRADGSTLALDDYLGEQNILVTTYRAFW